MNEKLLKIEEFKNYKSSEEDWATYEGYLITTDKRTIRIMVSDRSCCCEDWGHISSEDNIDDFIGSNIKELKYIEEGSWDETAPSRAANDIEYEDVFDCAFVNIITDKGLLQLTVYNHHNGYYGHDIRVIEKDITSN